MKKKFLTLLLLTTTLFSETDLRLNHYPKAIEWLQDADTNGESAYNIGVLYRKNIKDNDKAIEWYEKAYNMDDKKASINSSVNIAAIYVDLKKYKEAENWYKKGISKNSFQASFGLGLLYKKAYKMGHLGSANSLGYLYEHSLNDTKNAEKWYKKAIQENDKQGIGNLSKFYYTQHQVELGTAYFLSLANNGHSKQKVLSYLKTKWNLTDEEIKKAYQLQKILDIPKHYYDPEFEDKNTKKTGRH